MATPEEIFAAERAKLSGGVEGSANPAAIFNAERNRLATTARPEDIFASEKLRIAGEQQKEGGGFLEGLGNVLDTLNPLDIITNPREEIARTLVAGAGLIEGAVLSPLEAVAQIPGLFTKRELITDKLADFIARTSDDIRSSAERNALEAGLNEREISAAYATGDFIGFIAPLGISVSASKLLLRSEGQIAKHILTGNLVTDMTAGAIFGGVFKPEEDLADRGKSLLNESAAFGVGRIIINGLAAPAIGIRLKSLLRKEADEGVSTLIEASNNGKNIVIRDGTEALSLSALQSEEAYISSSAGAIDLLARAQDERVLIQAISDAAATTGKSGVVKGFRGTPAEIGTMIDSFKAEFPNLKFNKLKGKNGRTDIIFGETGLSNAKKAQYSKEGRVAGQIVSRGDVTYEYVGLGTKKGKIKVRNDATGKVSQILDKNLTDHLAIAEDVSAVGPMDALFDDFFSKLETGVKESSGGGALPESALIAGLRDGSIQLSDEVLRPFEVGGAISYTSELGTKEGIVTAQEVAQGIAKNGLEYGGVLTNPRVVAFEDMVREWAARADLPADAPDFNAMVSFFGKRAREKFWQGIPDEEIGVLNKLREEQLLMVEAGEIPFAADAHSKGFNSEIDANTGVVTLRDIMTGRRVQFGDQRVAEIALQGVIRPEGDMLGGSLLPTGTHGIGAFTGGFKTSEGIFSFDRGDVTREMLDDMPIFSGIRNMRDVLIDVESDTGITLFSNVFDKMDTGTTALRNFAEPWVRRTAKTWKKLSIDDRIQTTQVWRQLEGKGLSRVQEDAFVRAAGLSDAQQKAFRESRNIFDALGRQLGLEDSGQWVQSYYGRIQPLMESSGGNESLTSIYGGEVNIPAQVKAFFEQHRVGDMASVELDPLIVMNKYIRAASFKLHLEDNFNAARELVGGKTTPRIGDLQPAQAKKMLAKALVKNPDATLDTPILPVEVRNTLAEYLSIIRGNPTTGQSSTRKFFVNLLDKIGVKADPRALDQYVNNGLSMMYGSAMALRPSLVARNGTQAVWMSYSRLGARHGGIAFEKAMTLDGFREVSEAFAIRNTEAGVSAGDAIFDRMMDSVPIEGTGPMSKALASAMRGGLRVGNSLSTFARRGLIPYSSQDSMNRAVSYFWQKEFTASKLALFDSGKINWDKFLEDGLPFFHDVVKKDFANRFNKFGREDALRWIGKQGADEAQFIYGVGAQPAWMQNAAGRFVGMFGTWPMWALEAYGRRVASGTRAQQGVLWARTLALTGAFANMSIQSGYDMWKWIAPASVFGWTGGPAIDDAIQLKRVIDSPVDQKSDALKTLGRSVGRMSIPGQGFFRDFRKALGSESISEAGLKMMLGNPTDSYNFNIDILMDPAEGQRERSPEGVSGLKSLRGFQDFPNNPTLQATSPVSRQNLLRPGS